MYLQCPAEVGIQVLYFRKKTANKLFIASTVEMACKV